MSFTKTMTVLKLDLKLDILQLDRNSTKNFDRYLTETFKTPSTAHFQFVNLMSK